MANSARASTRISIRWPPEAAAEPTDTLVLSLGGYYVDLRILKEDQSLDWALAGERITVSEDPLKVKFTHIINSQGQHHHINHTGKDSKNHDDIVQPPEDVGDFVKLPNGDDFETGEMPAPHLGGKIAPYEEIWRQLSPTLLPTNNQDHDHRTGDQCPSCEVGTVAWILESVDVEDGKAPAAEDDGKSSAKSKTFFARIGRFYLAIRRVSCAAVGGEAKPATFSALRQEYVPEKKQWQDVYALGNVTGMSLSKDGELVTDSEYEKWKVGDQVTVNSEALESARQEVCIVRAVSRLTH